MSQKLSLVAQARQELKLAADAPSGRSAKTVYGGHERALRQTVIALRAGRSLEEHNNPGEATVHVLQGHIRLHAAPGNTHNAAYNPAPEAAHNAAPGNTHNAAREVVWEGLPGDLLIVPPGRHSIEAVGDSAFLLTVVKAV